MRLVWFLGVVSIVALGVGCFFPSRVTVEQDCALAANISACKAEKQREAEEAAAKEAALKKDFADHHPIMAWASENLPALMPLLLVVTVVSTAIVAAVREAVEAWRRARKVKGKPGVR